MARRISFSGSWLALFLALAPLHANADYSRALDALRGGNLDLALSEIKDAAADRNDRRYVDVVDELYRRRSLESFGDPRLVSQIYVALAEAAGVGPGETQYKLAQLSRLIHEHGKSTSYFEQAAALGHAASIYELGLNVARTAPRDGFELLRRAAHLDYGPAQHRIAEMYAYRSDLWGYAPEPDYKEAARWALRHAQSDRDDAAGRPRSYSMGLLAWLFFLGHVDGVPDYVAARQWAEKGGKNSPNGRLVLWKLYEGGLGVEKDDLRAAYWKLRTEAAHHFPMFGLKDWTFERMLLLSGVVIAGRAERLDTEGRHISADVVIDDVIHRSDSFQGVRATIVPGARMRIVLAQSSDYREQIERDFLNKSLIYPVNHIPQMWWGPKGAPGYNYVLLLNAGQQLPIGLDKVDAVRKTLARIGELGMRLDERY